MNRAMQSILLLSALAGAASADVYPTPQSMKLPGGTFPRPAAVAVKAGPDADGPAVRALSAAFRVDPAAAFTVTFSRMPAAGAAGKPRPGEYRLDVTPRGASVSGADGAGDFYAVQTLLQLLLDGPRAQEAAVHDWPDIPFRGTVEGFYGKPWGTEGRLAQFAFYGKWKMNTYIYGPKDDPYHTRKWHTPYPEKQAADFRRLLACARENHVNFFWAAHLGRAFSNPKQKEQNFAALFKKLDAMYALGFRSFAAFFDDFGGPDANLHSEICNRIQSDFIRRKKGCSPLVMCPQAYAGNGKNAYCRTLGERLDPEVRVMWTGPRVCSDIQAGPRNSLAEAIRRPPFVWWNWPVNDYYRRKLVMGRAYGVDPAEYAGFVSNPMENSEASKIALFSVADLTWNRKGFRSDASWRAGIRRLYPDCAAAMQLFACHNSYMNDRYAREESVDFRPLADRALQEYRSSGLTPAAAGELAAAFREMEGAAAALSSALPKNHPALWREIEPWVKSFALQSRLGSLAVRMTREKDASALPALFTEAAGLHASIEEIKQYGQTLQTASRIVRPLIDALLAGEWGRLRGGAAAPAFAPVYRAFSDIPAIARHGAAREGDRVLFDRILEPITARPGQSFGIALPPGLKPTGIRAKLGTPEAAAKGSLELSEDGGKTWKPCKADVRGNQMGASFRKGGRWNAARWRNASGEPIALKPELFQIDLDGNSSVTGPAAMTDGDPFTCHTLPAGASALLPAAAGAGRRKPAAIAIGSHTLTAEPGGIRITAGPAPVRVFEVLP